MSESCMHFVSLHGAPGAMAACSVLAACQLGIPIKLSFYKRACRKAIMLTMSQEGSQHSAVVHGPKCCCAWRKGMLLENPEGTAALLEQWRLRMRHSRCSWTQMMACVPPRTAERSPKSESPAQ